MTEMNFPTINVKATGEHIRQLRMENRLTVKDMQNFFNFEYPQTIYKWQWGICLPSIDNFVGLSFLFHKTIDDILVLDGEDVVYCFILFLLMHSILLH